MWPLSVALQEAIAQETGVRAAIKWPNDLVVRDRKLGGLLAETAHDCVVVGAGINVNFSATALALDQPFTTLADEFGEPISREALLIAGLRAFDRWYTRWLAAPEEVWQAWRAGSCLMGREVRVTVEKHTYCGTVEDLDRDGYLCVRLAGGELRRFAAGDASVRLNPAP
jgi:BirA family biotin operon repressor/biotin-[acetyl-CoA-carboxylase] ligase